MKIRKFKSKDSAATAELFRDTVRRVNSKDYSPEQINVWAPEDLENDAWLSRLEKAHIFVMESAIGAVLGFITIELDGYIDLLYVHADHQRRGVGSRLLAHAEKQAQICGIKRFHTEASITALPFFESHGFLVSKEQKARKQGVHFINYRMEKQL